MSTPQIPLAEAGASSGWASPVKLWQPRNPVYWVYFWLLINGAFVYAQTFTQISVAPSTFVIAITSQVAYGLVYVWFFARADRYEREPVKLAALAFLYGGLVSTYLIAAPANHAVMSLYAKWFGTDFATDFGGAFTAPLTEETAKLAAVVAAAMLARQHVRSAYDGLLLGMFAGLGFQVFENVQYMVRSVESNFNSEPVKDMLFTFVVRAGTGLFGHWLWTAVAGAGVGYYLGNPHLSKARRLGVAGGLLLVVMAAHGLFDAVLGIGLAALGIAIPLGVISFILVLRFTERRSRIWVSGLLAHDVSAGNVTEDELACLTGTLHDRRKYLRGVKRSEGKAAKKRARWVMEAQNQLAASIASTEDVQSPEAEVARAEVQRLRTVVAT